MARKNEEKKIGIRNLNMKRRGPSVKRVKRVNILGGWGAIWLHQDERAIWDKKWLHYERALVI